jgi:hypothetical protein
MAHATYYQYGPTHTHYFPMNATDPVPIQCKTSESCGKEYLVLEFGDVTIFATPEQIRQLHQVIGAWLDAESEQLAGVAGTTDTPTPVAHVPAGWDSVDTSTT